MIRIGGKPYCATCGVRFPCLVLQSEIYERAYGPDEDHHVYNLP